MPLLSLRSQSTDRSQGSSAHPSSAHQPPFRRTKGGWQSKAKRPVPPASTPPLVRPKRQQPIITTQMNTFQWRALPQSDYCPPLDMPPKTKQPLPQGSTEASTPPESPHELNGHAAITAAAVRDDLLSTEEVAEFCGTSVGTVLKWRRSGKLRDLPRLGKTYSFIRTDLQAALRKAIDLGYASGSQHAPKQARRSKTNRKKETTQ